MPAPQTPREVNVRVWDATEPSFRFPERTLWSDHDQRLPVGLVFSGGGTRAAACALGQLRALQQLGLLEKARYLSCVSGGSWCAVPYTFLPGSSDAHDWAFLGEPQEPRHLTPSELSRTRYDFTESIADSALAARVAKATLLDHAGDEAFARAVGDVFLADWIGHPHERFFTLDASSLASLVERNGGELSPHHFHTVQRPRPYLIANGTLLEDAGSALDLPSALLPSGSSDTRRWYLFEMTPLYAGVGARHFHAAYGGRNIGGGYVEPCGFDSHSHSLLSQTAEHDVRQVSLDRYVFSLSDVIGTSGAAPRDLLSKTTGNLVPRVARLFPRFRYWSVKRGEDERVSEHRHWEAPFGDGGLLENNGVLSLLRRGLRKIVVFVNNEREPRHSIDVKRLFGRDLRGTSGVLGASRKEAHVFPAGDYPAVQRALETDGWCLAEHEVLDNAWVGVAGGGERASVLWVYNAKRPSLAFQQALPYATRRRLPSRELSSFPHFGTFFPSGGDLGVINLTRAQTRLLTSLSWWRLLHQEGLSQALLEIFGANDALAASGGVGDVAVS